MKNSFTFSNRTAIAAILVAAVLLRLSSAFYQGNVVTELPGVYDQISYDGLARRVVDGYGFSFAEGHWPATRAGEPTAHWSYLYTLYLVVIYKLFGTFPLIARVVQALIGGVFQTILIWRIGTRLFNRTVGLVAAALNAVYIYFFYYAGALITETFYITGILWAFDSAFRIVDASRKMGEGRHGVTLGQWLEFCLAMGVTILLRQVFLLFLPFLYLWLWWNIRAWEAAGWQRLLGWSAIKGLAVATLVLALMMAPFTIRNYRTFGTFVLLNTNAGYAFFWGNHPIYGTRFIPILPSEIYQSLIPEELRSLDEAALDQALLKWGMQFVFDDPKRYILLSLSRIPSYFMFWPSADSGLASNVSRVASFGIFFPFMLYGLKLSLWKKRFDAGNRLISLLASPDGLLILFVVIYASIHLLTWALIRYRLPIDAVLIPFSAFALVHIFERRRR